jgi:hypothetical protein
MARAGSVPTHVSACDGKIVRGYSKNRIPDRRTGAMVSGSIRPADQFINFKYPFTFLYEFNGTPYSKLLARSPDAKVTETAGRTTVSFSHPSFKDRRFVLVFDREGSLLQRDVYGKYSREAAPRLREQHKFSGYRTYRNSAGESVWFPSEAVYDFILGTADDGQLIVYSHAHIDVNSFQFNHQIPDDLFVIQFPEGCLVMDGINNLRWLQQKR